MFGALIFTLVVILAASLINFFFGFAITDAVTYMVLYLVAELSIHTYTELEDEED